MTNSVDTVSPAPERSDGPVDGMFRARAADGQLPVPSHGAAIVVPAASDRWHELRIVGRFFLHTTVGILLFGIVALAAALLDAGTDLLRAKGVSSYLVEALKGLELFLFVVDMICFVAFMLKEAWEFIRSLWAS